MENSQFLPIYALFDIAECLEDHTLAKMCVVSQETEYVTSKFPFLSQENHKKLYKENQKWDNPDIDVVLDEFGPTDKITHTFETEEEGVYIIFVKSVDGKADICIIDVMDPEESRLTTTITAPQNVVDIFHHKSSIALIQEDVVRDTYKFVVLDVATFNFEKIPELEDLFILKWCHYEDYCYLVMQESPDKWLNMCYVLMVSLTKKKVVSKQFYGYGNAFIDPDMNVSCTKDIFTLKFDGNSKLLHARTFEGAQAWMGDFECSDFDQGYLTHSFQLKDCGLHYYKREHAVTGDRLKVSFFDSNYVCTAKSAGTAAFVPISAFQQNAGGDIYCCSDDQLYRISHWSMKDEALPDPLPLLSSPLKNGLFTDIYPIEDEENLILVEIEVNEQLHRLVVFDMKLGIFKKAMDSKSYFEKIGNNSWLTNGSYGPRLICHQKWTD